MRRMRVVAAAAAAVLALAGCGGPTESPEEVVKAASDASVRADVEELERRLDPPMFAELLRAGGGDRERLREQLRVSNRQARVKNYIVLDTKIEGDAATVDTEALVTIIASGHEIRTRGRTHLKKIDNAWRLSGVEVLGQPEVVEPAAGPESE